MNGPGKGDKLPGKESLKPPLPKRFYKSAAIKPAEAGSGFAVTLDGRQVRTPGKAVLTVPKQALAQAIADEWQAQGEHIDPAAMPLTRYANSVIDGVIERADDVRADILKYAGSDLVCYRADGPSPLVDRQRKAWDPILAWARKAMNARLVLTEGVMPITQPDYGLTGIADALNALDPWRLAGVHTITTLTGSVLLALAHVQGELSADDLWHAAHVDEDWQIEQWGEDAEAAERRQYRRGELNSASRLLALINQA